MGLKNSDCFFNLKLKINLRFGTGLRPFISTYLSLERLLVLQHVDQFRVVDLQKHSGDFTGQLRVHLHKKWHCKPGTPKIPVKLNQVLYLLNEWEEAFAKHLLLLLGWCRSQHRGSQGLLSVNNDSSLGCCHLLRHHLWGHHHLNLFKNKVVRPEYTDRE